MNDYKNFLNDNQNNYYIISSEKITNNNALMCFSLKNISTTCTNSHISNDFQSFKYNGIQNNMDMNDVTKQKLNEITFKTNNNYYNKKDYSKYLNIRQSNDSTCCDSKYKFFSKNQSNKESNNPNLNSNLKENNIYNKLKINELIEITKKRKKLIEEKKRLEELKKLKISLEEEKLLKFINIDDNNNNNINKNCDDGVQTSLTIKKNKYENKIVNEDNYNFESNNDIKFKIEKNTIENDLVNIGNDTIKNNNQDLIFDIEENEDNSNNKEKLKYNESLENKDKENSYSSSNNDNENEISKVEEYDINEEYSKNETKSDIQDYIDENEIKKGKINIKLNKCKSVTSMALNRYENIDIKNSGNFYSMNDNQKNNDKKTKINVADLNEIKDKNNNINNNKEIDQISNIIKNSYSIKNIYGKRNHCINLGQNKKFVVKLRIIPLKEQNNNIKSESNRTKKKRQMDNYSYYYQLKEKNTNL